MHKSLKALGLLLGAAWCSAPALAATAYASTPGMTAIPVDVTNPGAAFADAVSSFEQGTGVAHASAFEFRGGVGVSAITDARGGPYGAGANANASAGSTTTFYVSERTPGIISLGDGVHFVLRVSLEATGFSTASRAEGSYAASGYSYSYNVGGHSGSYATSQEYNYDGSFRGDPGLTPLLDFDVEVVRGPAVTMSYSAFASAFAGAGAFSAASAAADYSHTLRWGGVLSVTAFDSNGDEIDLPNGFQLALMSEDGEFDFMNAAFNPYITPAPEPGEWAMMAAGLGIVGAVARRRKNRDTATGGNAR